MTKGLTHIDERGAARIVDITGKTPSARFAVARSRITFPAHQRNSLDVEDKFLQLTASARAVAIQSAKRTSRMIPLCHPILVGDVFVDFELDETGIVIQAKVHVQERTGPEIEAMVACSIAALVIYESFRSDPVRPVIGPVALFEKFGGKSGHWRRMDPSNADGAQS